MNDTSAAQVAAALVMDLRAFMTVCEEILGLAQREHQALSSPAEYQHQDFSERRKKMLPDIELLARKFRSHRSVWQQISPARRESFPELKRLFQNVQNLLLRVMLLDRENQQAMLRRGLVPVKHLSAAGTQQPHYVADLYRKNSPGGAQ